MDGHKSKRVSLRRFPSCSSYLYCCVGFETSFRGQTTSNIVEQHTTNCNSQRQYPLRVVLEITACGLVDLWTYFWSGPMRWDGHLPSRIIKQINSCSVGVVGDGVHDVQKIPGPSFNVQRANAGVQCARRRTHSHKAQAQEAEENKALDECSVLGGWYYIGSTSYAAAVAAGGVNRSTINKKIGKIISK